MAEAVGAGIQFGNEAARRGNLLRLAQLFARNLWAISNPSGRAAPVWPDPASRPKPMMHQKPENRAGGRASPCLEAGVPEARVAGWRTTERGRRKFGSVLAHNSLPSPQGTQGNAPLSPPGTSLTGERNCHDLREPLTDQTPVVISQFRPEWCDSSKAGRKRRVFSADEKARIVSESFESGQSVCSVARRYRLRASQLFAWRKFARLGREKSERTGGIVPSGASVDSCDGGLPAPAAKTPPD